MRVAHAPPHVGAPEGAGRGHGGAAGAPEAATARRRAGLPARPQGAPGSIVSELRGLAAVLRARGYAVVADEPLEGFDRLYASDPFGNRVELMEPVDGPHAGASCGINRRMLR